MTLRRAAGAAACAAVVSLLLAGCTPSSESAETAVATPGPTSTPTPAPVAACIIGTWHADAGALQPVYDAIPVGLDYPTATLDPAASVIVAFAADDAFTMAQDVAATLLWEGHPAAVHLAGTMRGTYTTSGDALALTATDNLLTATPSDDRTGSALFAFATQETLGEWPVSATSFSCDGDTLVLDLETEGHPASIEFVRH